MDWRDILKNAVATTSLANIQVDDDYSDLEEDYNEDCKKRLRAFLEKIEGELRYLLVKANPIMEKYGKEVYQLASLDNYYIGNFGRAIDFQIVMKDFDRVKFDKLSEEYCCNVIENIKKAHAKQSSIENSDSKISTMIITRKGKAEKNLKTRIKEFTSIISNTPLIDAKEDLDFEYSFHVFSPRKSKKIDEDSEEWKEYYQGIHKMAEEMNRKIDSLITSL